MRTVSAVGNIGLDCVSYKVGAQHAFRQVLIISVDDRVIITDLDGEVLAERVRPQPGVKYVGNGRPRGGPGSPPHNRHRSPDTPTVTDVLMQNRHKCPETSHRYGPTT
jgi:hypothetical protein